MVVSVLFALAASLSWGMSDFGAGLKSRTLPLVAVMFWIQALGLGLSAVLVVASGDPLPNSGQALASLAAGAAGLVGLACFYRALATGVMSVVAPIGATGVALPVLVGVLGGDRLSTAQILGLAAALLGVLAASREGEHGQDGQSAASRRAVVLALVAAAGFGCYFIGSHIGVRGGLPWLLLLSHTVGFLGVSAVALARRVPVGAPGGDRVVLVAVGLLDLVATAFYGLANRHGLLSVVAVVGSLYPVATVVLARVVLHERVARLQAVGIGLALAGVGLIAGG